MKRRVLLAATALTVGGGLYLLTPGTSAKPHAASNPPTCVVVNGPNGLTIQVGYAPTGPGDCQQF
jgi:hypothetical protein